MKIKLHREVGSFLNNVLAFIMRGFITLLSYRVLLILTMVNIILGIATFYFFCDFYLKTGIVREALLIYGGNPIAFIMLGTVFQDFVNLGLTSFNKAISREQVEGTLEFLLLSPTKLFTILICESIWNTMLTSIGAALGLAITVYVFGVNLSNANYISCMVILTLLVLSMSGIGMISAGIVLVTKQGDPIAWLFGYLIGLLSGMLYPVEALPPILQQIAYVIPVTYAMRSARLALLRGYTLFHPIVSYDAMMLLISALITIPLGALSFKLGFKKARIDGSLGEY